MHGMQPLTAMVIVIKVVTAPARRNNMGYKNPLDYNRVHHQIYMTGVELHHPGNDGFTQWYMKQDLYKLKWLIDEILADSPAFAGEEEFLKEHDQVKMWRTLTK